MPVGAPVANDRPPVRRCRDLDAPGLAVARPAASTAHQQASEHFVARLGYRVPGSVPGPRSGAPSGRLLWPSVLDATNCVRLFTSSKRHAASRVLSCRRISISAKSDLFDRPPVRVPRSRCARPRSSSPRGVATRALQRPERLLWPSVLDQRLGKRHVHERIQHGTATRVASLRAGMAASTSPCRK